MVVVHDVVEHAVIEPRNADTVKSSDPKFVPVSVNDAPPPAPDVGHD